jgi:hypothetical protein
MACVLALLSLLQTFLPIVTRGVRSFLHADAQIGLHAMIGVVNQSPCLTKHVQGANGMADPRPALRNGLSLGGVSIADPPDHRDLQCQHRCQKRFEALFRTRRPLFGMQSPSR